MAGDRGSGPELLTADQRQRLLHLVPEEWHLEQLVRLLPDLRGFRSGRSAQYGPAYPGRAFALEELQVEVTADESFGFGGEINREVHRRIDYFVHADGEEIARFSHKFLKLTGEDLLDLAALKRFVSDILGSEDTSQWSTIYRDKFAEAEAYIERRLAEIESRDRPRPASTKAEWHARRPEFDAWHDAYTRDVLEASRAAWAGLAIAGTSSGVIWQLLWQVFGGQARSDDSWSLADSAYQLGRSIREAEIERDFENWVKYGKASKAKAVKRGKKTGGGSKEIADNAWRNDADVVRLRVQAEEPNWGSKKIARQIQKEVAGAANLEPDTVKAWVEGRRKEERAAVRT